MADAFKAGDIVTLKSGGPAVTLKVRIKSGQWTANWFTTAGQLMAGGFPESC